MKSKDNNWKCIHSLTDFTSHLTWYEKIGKMNKRGLIHRVSVFIQCGSLNKFPCSFAVYIDITTFNFKFTNLYIITNIVFLSFCLGLWGFFFWGGGGCKLNVYFNSKIHVLLLLLSYKVCLYFKRIGVNFLMFYIYI